MGIPDEIETGGVIPAHTHTHTNTHTHTHTHTHTGIFFPCSPKCPELGGGGVYNMIFWKF
jgi:hypothetical protein